MGTNVYGSIQQLINNLSGLPEEEKQASLQIQLESIYANEIISKWKNEFRYCDEHCKVFRILNQCKYMEQFVPEFNHNDDYMNSRRN